MPFITIELSQNVTFSLEPFAKAIHEYIASMLDVPIEKLKSKKVIAAEFFLGSGNNDSGYARFRLELMSGRDREKLKGTLMGLLQQFREEVLKQNPKLSCRVTAEIAEIDREFLLAGPIICDLPHSCAT